jgi:hypothetical protein
MPDYIDIIVTETPTYIDVAEQQSVYIDIDLGGGSGGGGSVDSVTGAVVDNTDPANPVINADASGSAAAALVAANAYTDTEVSGVNQVPNSGTTGQVLIKNSATDGDTGWLSIYGSMPVIPSNWRGTPSVGLQNYGTNFNNQIYFAPYFVEKGHTVTGIRCFIGTGKAATTAKLALYSSDGYEPLTLIEESGDLDTSTSGIKTYMFSSPISLTGSIYWMGVQLSSGTPLNIYVNATGSAGSFTRTSDVPFMAVRKAQSYGSFPTPLTGLSYLTANTNLTPVLQMLVQ